VTSYDRDFWEVADVHVAGSVDEMVRRMTAGVAPRGGHRRRRRDPRTE
jgi:hypothetical protein